MSPKSAAEKRREQRDAIDTEIARLLAGALSMGEVEGGGRLHLNSTDAMDILEKAASILAGNYEQWLTGSQAKLSLFLRARLFLPDCSDGKVSDLFSEEQLTAAARASVKWHESLPRRYVVYFSLPEYGPLGLDQIEVAPGIAITEGNLLEQTQGLVVKKDEPQSIERGANAKPRYLRPERNGCALMGYEDESALATAIGVARAIVLIGELEGCFRQGPEDFGEKALPSANAAVVDIASGKFIRPLS